MEARERKISESTFSTGSALILTVVLTSMLAIVGLLFVMMARVDKVATSAISENKELNLAVETVIAGISQQLVSDVPGVVAGQEYYDYPGVDDAWLASLEPKLNDGGTPADPADDIYYWRHISDVNNQLGPGAWALPAVIVPDYQDPCDIFTGRLADADADGIADSRWVIMPDMTSSKGESIYAAVRVVDNGAMLNVNTGYKFDPCDILKRIDGSSQLQINLMALSWRPGVTIYDPCDEIGLLEARANPALGLNPLDLRLYEQNVIWRYGQPNGPYTPFDISDELELRNRYLLNHLGIDARIENTATFWSDAFTINDELHVPVDSNIGDWFFRVQNDVPGTKNYSYRHIATTYNMDRIIDPKGGKMIDVNDVDNLVGIPHERYSQIFPLYFLDMNTPVGILYDRLLSSLGPVIADSNTVTQYAHLAANITDFCDDDDINNDGVLDAGCVTTLVDPYDPCVIHCGFEAQPFITEIGIILPGTGQFDRSKPPVQIDPGQSSFAVELYNPFDCNIPLRDFVLELFNRRLSDTRVITFNPGDVIYANSCFVISNNPSDFGLLPSPNVIVRPELILFAEPDKSKPAVPIGSSDYSYDIFLKRIVNLAWPMIYVDKQEIYPSPVLNQPTSQILYLGRCVSDWHVVYQTLIPDSGTLGIVNNIPPTLFPEHNFSFFLPNPLYPPARLITVGDIPRILTLGHGITRDSTIGEQLGRRIISEENQVRLDLANPYHSNVFQYLTVFDPSSDSNDNDADGLIDENDGSEWKVPGRININTAPWYVLGQLPWVSPHTPNYELARAIVDYRDVVGAFGSIGELNFVSDPNSLRSIGYYARTDVQAGDLLSFPDITPADGVLNDFEERDVIFSRISNLVSVRSDVFTAYILVRIGADGPQKRVVAILDRSGVNEANVSLPDGKVRIVALHYVPDPR